MSTLQQQQAWESCLTDYLEYLLLMRERAHRTDRPPLYLPDWLSEEAMDEARVVVAREYPMFDGVKRFSEAPPRD